MAYHIEHKGVPLSSRQSDIAAYVLQGSVSIETAVAERPTAALSVRVPPGVTLAPKDFDEVTIDYPALPYRAWAERHANLVAYWRLDEAASVLAVDSKGATPLTYGGGKTSSIGRSARRHRPCPTAGLLSGRTRSATGCTRMCSRSGIGTMSRLQDSSGRTLAVAAIGMSGKRTRPPGRSVCRPMDRSEPGSTVGRSTPAGTIADNTWHHVAVTRTTSRVRLVVDGVEIVNVVGQTATPIDSLQWSMARADGNEPVNLALDEWGIWSEVLDVAALYARRTHHRAFGGYVYGVVDATDLGPADQHVLSLSLAGYGCGSTTATCGRFTPVPAGRPSVRSSRTCSSGPGWMTCSRRTASSWTTRSPARRLPGAVGHDDSPRSLADLHGAIVTVDEWLEIDLVRRTNLENSRWS